MARCVRVSVWCGLLWLMCPGWLAPGARGAEEVAPAVLVSRARGGWAEGGEWPFASGERPQGALRRLLPAGRERTPGQPIEMGGDRVLRFNYCDTFSEPWFAEDPAIEGTGCLRWDPSAPALWLEGRGPQRRRVSLTYRFTALYDAKELVTEVQGIVRGGRGDCVELTMSTDGRTFIHPARAWGRPEGNPFRLTAAASYQFDRPGFWIRIAADLAPGSSVALSQFKAACRVKPPGTPAAVLSEDSAGRLSYRDPLSSSRLLHLAEVENGDTLEWRRGGAVLSGPPGGTAQVTIRQRFIAPAPLRAVAVRVRHAVGPRHLGGANTLGLSLDGANVLTTRVVEGGEGGFAGVTELRLDNAAVLGQAREFWLHITLASGPGAQGRPSNALGGIEAEALPAAPLAPAIAATESAGHGP